MGVMALLLGTLLGLLSKSSRFPLDLGRACGIAPQSPIENLEAASSAGNPVAEKRQGSIVTTWYLSYQIPKMPRFFHPSMFVY